MLERGLQHLKKNPQRISRVRSVLRLAPGLERKLTHFAHARGYGVAATRGTAASWMIDPDPSVVLSWSRLLNDLQDAGSVPGRVGKR
jgi:hypothetical protein